MKKPKKRRRPRVRTTLKEEVGRMLLDIGRMVFAGIVIVEILRGQIRGIDDDMLHDILFFAGCAVVFLCNTFGLIMVKREIKPDKVKRLAMPIHKRWRVKRSKR